MAHPGERPPGRGPRRRRLSRSADFDRVHRSGRSQASRHLVLHAFPREADAEGPRLGISVSRKVGGAVERNRVKRLLREAFWALAPALGPREDFVLVARPAAADLARTGGEPAVEAAVRELLLSAGLLEAPSGS